MALEIIGYNETFGAFVKFAEAQQAAGKEKAVALLDESEVGGIINRNIKSVSGDWVGVGAGRLASLKNANNTTRDAFMKAVGEMFGGEDHIPAVVRDAMKMQDYGKVKTYAEADEKTKIKASLLMAFSCQGFVGCGMKGVSNAFVPDGNSGRLLTGKGTSGNNRTDSLKLSKDKEGNIVITSVTGFKSGNVALTNERKRSDLYSIGKGGSMEYRLNVVVSKESLEKFVNADWTNFDSKKIDKIESDYTVPHSMERSAEALPPEFKLDLQQVDISFSIAVDKLKEVY